jgi:signal transduction histidine kinase
MSAKNKSGRFTAYGLKKGRDRYMRIFLIFLLLLLPVLAYQQYQWLGQLSEAEMVRTSSNLKISAERFAEDFDRQLTLIYRTFQREEDRGQKVDDVNYFLKDCYRKLQASSPADSLIEAVYFIAINREPAQLFQFDPTAGQAKPAHWLPSMDFIKDVIRSRDRNNLLQLLRLTQTPWLTEEPLIITSDAPPLLFDSPGQPHFHLIILALNNSYLHDKLIPALIDTHFGGFEDLTFDLAIARKDSQTDRFYCSDTSLTATAFENADVRTDVGRWRMRGVFIATAIMEKEKINVQKYVHNLEKTEISLKVITQDSLEQKEFARYLISQLPGWELLVKHHGGSLEAAIAATRRRNLAISYGILLLLGVSVVMVFVSAQRAKRLAVQQMEFVAGVSHELRTPLSVIRSAGENLADGVIHGDRQSRHYGALIRDEGRRLSGLVEQVLAFAGVQSSRAALVRESCHINAIIENVLSELNGELKQSGADIRTDLQPDLPAMACDREGMMIVLKNILINAMKYNTHEPQIKLASGFDTRHKKIVITVCDNGMGINKEEQRQIFEPFYRGQRVMDAQIRGSGLGLSLAKKIIELHRGEITVRSLETGGSCFEIFLPAGELPA